MDLNGWCCIEHLSAQVEKKPLYIYYFIQYSHRTPPISPLASCTSSKGFTHQQAFSIILILISSVKKSFLCWKILTVVVDK